MWELLWGLWVWYNAWWDIETLVDWGECKSVNDCNDALWLQNESRSPRWSFHHYRPRISVTISSPSKLIHNKTHGKRIISRRLWSDIQRKTHPNGWRINFPYISWVLEQSKRANAKIGKSYKRSVAKRKNRKELDEIIHGTRIMALLASVIEDQYKGY